MTVLSRGARSRRSGRRPGWTLVTALLVLAIAASSALVFTNRTELLKLAVILALWAAVVAAFVSVIYRRQSDIDQAKARDLKLVYDLQLDREIAARREYELEVEAQLRRELSAELRSDAADEVAALRAELAALRTNLEILFETDLAHRPAIETERTTARVYSDWERDSERTEPSGAGRGTYTASAWHGGGVEGSAWHGGGVTGSAWHGGGVEGSAWHGGGVEEASEDHIIDVHEEPPQPEEPLGQRPSGLYVPPSYGGTHRPASEERGWSAPTAEPPPQPVFAPQPPPVFRPEPEPEPNAEEWQPAPAEEEWLPPAAPGRSSGNGFSRPEAEPPVTAEPRRARHASEAEPHKAAPPPPPPAAPPPPVTPEPVAQPEYGAAASGRRARHSVEAEGFVPPSATFPTPPAPPSARHRTAEEEGESQHAQGQSVAELLARFQQGAPGEGGRRRRRDG
jgi:hypothetical protein